MADARLPHSPHTARRTARMPLHALRVPAWLAGSYRKGLVHYSPTLCLRRFISTFGSALPLTPFCRFRYLLFWLFDSPYVLRSPLLRACLAAHLTWCVLLQRHSFVAAFSRDCTRQYACARVTGFAPFTAPVRVLPRLTARTFSVRYSPYHSPPCYLLASRCRAPILTTATGPFRLIPQFFPLYDSDTHLLIACLPLRNLPRSLYA